jgi:hypothetical protein
VRIVLYRGDRDSGVIDATQTKTKKKVSVEQMEMPFGCADRVITSSDIWNIFTI